MFRFFYNIKNLTRIVSNTRNSSTDDTKDKTSIAFVLPSLSGGGAERVLLTASTHFSSAYYNKTLVLLTKKGNVISELPEFNNVIFLSSASTAASIFKLHFFLWRHQPNIVFSTLLRSHIAVSLATMLLRYRPFLVYRSPNMPNEYLKLPEWSGLKSLLLSYSYRKSHLIIAQTKEMGDQIYSRHRTINTPIKIAKNPIDLERVYKLSIKNSAVSKIPGSDIKLIFVGRITQQKGLDFLIAAFARFRLDYPRATLQIIGADVSNLQNELENLAQGLGCAEGVYFRGFFENPYPLIKESTVLVLGSRYEGFPNIILESIALNIPIVCTRCADGLDQILTGDKNGVLIDFGDISGFCDAVLMAKSITSFELPKQVCYKSIIEAERASKIY